MSARHLLILAGALLAAAPTLAKSPKTAPAQADTAAPADAGGPPTGGLADGGPPLEVTADKSLEWLQQDMAYVARGNAIATRGDQRVQADILTARYRNKPKGGTEIFKVLADGSVIAHAEAEDATAWGDHGVYDVDTQTVVLTGTALKFQDPDETVTARDALEFDQRSNTAYARGKAKLVRDDDIVTADLLTAKFNNGHAPPPAPVVRPGHAGATTPRKPSRLSALTADGNVVLTTPGDVVHGDHATYDFPTDKVLVTGRVRITHGKSQLDGSRAEVDLATGVSRMLPDATGRVRALIFGGDKSAAQ